MPILKKSSTRKSSAKKSGAKKSSVRRTTIRKSASGKRAGARRTTSTKIAARKRASATRSAGKGLMKPMQPDAKLAVIVGSRKMPRTEITKKVWAYIKRYDLQDPRNRRMINADAKLQQVLGGKKRVSMFEMAKLVSQHIKP